MARAHQTRHMQAGRYLPVRSDETALSRVVFRWHLEYILQATHFVVAPPRALAQELAPGPAQDQQAQQCGYVARGTPSLNRLFVAPLRYYHQCDSSTKIRLLQ